LKTVSFLNKLNIQTLSACVSVFIWTTTNSLHFTKNV